jgi:hypothetical protein
MLGRIIGQKALGLPMQDGARGDHLGVQPRLPREKPQEEPEMTIRPIHHGGDA